MKIAIVGCSFSAYRQRDVEKNHWSFQLSQRFPQHQYYNYALGGRGIDHSQWSLLDAFERGINTVFFNTTYLHRVQYLIGDDNHCFDTEQISDNYTCMDLNSKHIWSSNPPDVKMHPPHPSDGPILKQSVPLVVEQATSEHRYNYIKKFYQNVDKMYNFKNFFLLKFHKGSESERYLGSDHVWNKLVDTDNLPGYGNRHLWHNGYVLSETDDHWTLKGNKWVLENYILTPKVIDKLSQ